MANGEGGHDLRLPIKLILPNQGQNRPVKGGGGPVKPFKEVTQEYRTSLNRQVLEIEKTVHQLGSSSRRLVPLRLELIPKAVAKSHRPKRLFSDKTCPVIGAGKMGELYLRATPEGLKALGEMIMKDDSPAAQKEVSSIERIEVVTPDYRRRKISSVDILRQSPRTQNGYLTRIRLFDFGAADQDVVVGDLEKFCRDRSLLISGSGYSQQGYTYGVECKSENDVEELSRVVGVRAVSAMPLVKVLRPKALNHRALPGQLPKYSEGDVPVVVVVDSGVSSDIPELESWVVGRDSKVAPAYRNVDHGTFVAGLICWGANLNPNLNGISSDPCAVFDLQVIPNSDPDFGEVDELTEQQLLQTLESSLTQYANRFKVWNLSLGSNLLCSLDEFSPFAEQLDNLQEQYQVSFVISAGNYDSPPLLDYPRSSVQLVSGRITSPADSVLGITVGSISHIDYAQKGPKVKCPSAFSRHGAGPNYIIKPDLVHFGGTCSTDLQHVSGICSVNGKLLAEDLGTSFATPLVSRTLAQIYHQITPTPSPVLARALLTHHARDPRTGGRVPDGEENFLGFGMPAALPYCIECEPHTSTLVFEDVLRPGFYLEWDDFPYPPSLQRNGKYYGEIWMTVAFAPARGGRWGTEYCETHVDAHFGVFVDQTNRKTGEIKRKFKGLVPPEHKNPGSLYESFQVKELRKWAPVRTYHGDLGKGERGVRWRLKLQLLTRHGIEEQEAQKPQPFGLLVTISDPEKKAPVYDEMAQTIRTRFKSDNLTIRGSAQVRSRS